MEVLTNTILSKLLFVFYNIEKNFQIDMPQPLPSMHYSVLTLLISGSTTSKIISQTLNVSKQQLTPILANLEKKELIIRRKGINTDKRYTSIEITEKGMEYVLLSFNSFIEYLNTIFSSMSDNDKKILKDFFNLIDKMVDLPK